jgi:hypothetical protein
MNEEEFILHVQSVENEKVGDHVRHRVKVEEAPRVHHERVIRTIPMGLPLEDNHRRIMRTLDLNMIRLRLNSRTDEILKFREGTRRL